MELGKERLGERRRGERTPAPSFGLSDSFSASCIFPQRPSSQALHGKRSAHDTRSKARTQTGTKTVLGKTLPALMLILSVGASWVHLRAAGERRRERSTIFPPPPLSGHLPPGEVLLQGQLCSELLRLTPWASGPSFPM